MKIEKINHVDIAVNDLDASLDFWSGVLGLKVDHVEEVPSYQVKVAFLPAGESDIELVMAVQKIPPAASKLPGKGEGLDHLCLEEKDLAEALAEMKSKGVRLINENHVNLTDGKLPSSTLPPPAGFCWNSTS